MDVCIHTVIILIAVLISIRELNIEGRSVEEPWNGGRNVARVAVGVRRASFSNRGQSRPVLSAGTPESLEVRADGPS